MVLVEHGIAFNWWVEIIWKKVYLLNQVTKNRANLSTLGIKCANIQTYVLLHSNFFLWIVKYMMPTEKSCSICVYKASWSKWDNAFYLWVQFGIRHNYLHHYYLFAKEIKYAARLWGSTAMLTMSYSWNTFSTSKLRFLIMKLKSIITWVVIQLSWLHWERP